MSDRNLEASGGWVLRLIRDESGPTGTEYAVMLGLIIIGVLTTIASIGAKMNDAFTYISDTVDVA